MTSLATEQKEWEAILKLHEELLSADEPGGNFKKIKLLEQEIDQRTWLFLARNIPFLSILPQAAIQLGKLLIGQRLALIDHKHYIVDDVHGTRKELYTVMEIEAQNSIFKQEISGIENEIKIFLSLYTSPSAGRIWEELIGCENGDINAVPIALNNAFHGWRNKVRSSKSDQKKDLLQVVGCLKKILKIFDRDVYVQQICNDVFWQSIAKKFSETAKFWGGGEFGKDMNPQVQLLQSFCREVETQEALDKELNEEFPEMRNAGESGIMIGLLHLPELIEIIIEEVENNASELLYPSANSIFSPKESSAEKIFFTRMLAEGVEGAFGKSRPSIIVKLLPIINPDWNDDESLVLKNLKRRIEDSA